jgi:hypothetical protein
MSGARWLTALAVAGTVPAVLAGQIRVSGGLTATGDLYHRTGMSFTAPRPAQTGQLAADLTIDFLNGVFTVPLTALVSSDGVQFRQQINQLGLSPTYRSVTVYLGSFTPEYSRYTFTDATLLGGGFLVHRSAFRVGAVAGRAQRAVRPDSATLLGDPQYARVAAGAQLGVGAHDASYLDLFFLTAKDDRHSLDTAVTNSFPLSPQEDRVFGAKGRAALVDTRVTLEGEAARSTYQAELGGTAPAVTSQAASGKLLYNAPTWGLGGTVEYLAAGFKTLGNSGLTDDRVDYGLTGRAQLAGGRLQLNGMGGWRKNNLSDALDATTTQAIYNLTGSWQPSAVFGLDLQAANTVNDSRAKDDTSSIRNVTGQYALTPHVLWRTGSAQHVLVLSATSQRSDNSTPGSIVLVDTRTTTLLGTWTVSFPSTLSLTAVATHTQVQLDTGRTTVLTLQPGVAYAFLAHKLQVAAQAQFSVVQNPSGGKDTEAFPLLQLRYAIAPGQTLQVRSSVRHHATAANGSFDERMVTVQYAASFR